MSSPSRRILPVALGAGLALALPIAVRAQDTNRNNTNSTAGPTQTPPGRGNIDLPRQMPPGTGGYPTPDRGATRPGVRFGQEAAPPGERFILPDDDPTRDPLSGPGRANYSNQEMHELTKRLLARARQINDPAERTLAFDRAARAKIAANKIEDDRTAYEDARSALIEAGQSALRIQDHLIHDQRIADVVATSIALAGEQGRLGLLNQTLADNSPTRRLTRQDRDFWLARARESWASAAVLADKTYNPAFRSQTLFEIASGEALSSQQIAVAAAQAGPESSRSDLAGLEDDLHRQADVELVSARDIAWKIQRPVWRDKTLVSITEAASNSKQYVRGLEIARGIPQPEFRCDALIRLAESQARRDATSGATSTYAEAARVVASIPLDAPRNILAGVLIDSLITVGRFEDARASAVFYPDTERRLRVLGAVAESMGERRLVDSAADWINREVPQQYQARIRRRLGDGVLKALDKFRSKGQGAPPEGDYPKADSNLLDENKPK